MGPIMKPKRLQDPVTGEWVFNCGVPTCLYLAPTHAECCNHQQSAYHEEQAVTADARCNNSLGYTPKPLQATMIRIDLYHGIAVCHASGVMLSKAEIPLHCKICPWCETLTVQQVQDLYKYSAICDDASTTFVQKFNVAGALRVRGVAPLELDHTHLPRGVYGVQTKVRVLCKACYDLSNEIVTLAPGKVQDHMQSLHWCEGGIAQELLQASAGCNAMVIRLHGEALATEQHYDENQLKFVAVQKVSNGRGMGTTVCTWMDYDEVYNWQRVDTQFDGVETTYIDMDSGNEDKHLKSIARYYFQWAYNGLPNYPVAMRQQVVDKQFKGGVMAPFGFHSSMIQTRDVFCQLVALLCRYQDAANGKFGLTVEQQSAVSAFTETVGKRDGGCDIVDDETIAILSHYVSHKFPQGSLPDDLPYANWYHAELKTAAATTATTTTATKAPGAVHIDSGQVVTAMVESMDEPLGRAMKTLHEALTLVFQDNAVLLRLVASLCMLNRDPLATVRLCAYAVRLVGVIGGVQISGSVARVMDPLTVASFLEYDSAMLTFDQVQGVLDTLTQRVYQGVLHLLDGRELSEKGARQLARQVAPRAAQELKLRVASLERLQACVDFMVGGPCHPRDAVRRTLNQLVSTLHPHLSTLCTGPNDWVPTFYKVTLVLLGRTLTPNGWKAATRGFDFERYLVHSLKFVVCEDKKKK